MTTDMHITQAESQGLSRDYGVAEYRFTIVRLTHNWKVSISKRTRDHIWTHVAEAKSTSLSYAIKRVTKDFSSEVQDELLKSLK